MCPLTFTRAIDYFIRDGRNASRINSDGTEVAYRHALSRHADDIGNHHPRWPVA